MTNNLRDAFTRLFARKPVSRADVWITPYIYLTGGDLTEGELQIKDRIAVALDCYQERMVERHRAISPLFARIQQISAHWNPGTNHISVIGSGDRSFWWEGSLDRFLGTDVLLEAA